MRSFLFIVCFVSSFLCAFSSPETDSLLSKLKYEFSRKEYYDRQKEDRINNLRKAYLGLKADNTAGQFDGCRQLYEEYKSYKYDSAYVYASRMYTLSLNSHDRVKENYSKMKMGFILLSAGKYKEAFSLIETIDHTSFDEPAMENYYAVMTRANFDLASYDNDVIYSPVYKAKGNLYLDSAIRLSAPDSYSLLFLTSYRNFSNGDNAAAINGFVDFYQKYKPSGHDDAITTSLLSELYVKTNEGEKAINYLIRAVIADLQASTKETLAIFHLAELTSRSGDIDDAYIYIQEALKDAEFYGARQRQIQISTVLPLIAGQKVSFIESQKSRFLMYLASTALLALLIVVISILLYKQLQQRKAREKIIQQNNAKLESMNVQLVEVNKQVVAANGKFAEDAHIKEEYIGYFFNVISGYILKLEKLKVSIEAKLIQNKGDQIQQIINEIQVNKEREALFQTFDKVFLKIFPNFVVSFNALFKKEDQVWPKDHEILTTDLRIYALTRLGIHDSESIAKILQYSAKTIYVYKMRLKAKSIYPAAEFDERLMDIKAVEVPAKAEFDYDVQAPA
jgi:hypothetical protein